LDIIASEKVSLILQSHTLLELASDFFKLSDELKQYVLL